MTVTVSAQNGAGSATPITVLSPYATRWEGRNIIHDLIGGDLAVSLVAPRPRAGTIRYLFEGETEAIACAQLHREESAFQLTDTETPAVSMQYVLDGAAEAALDPDTLQLWIVTVEYQAVI